MHHKNAMIAASEKLVSLGYETETPDMSEREDYTALPPQKRAATKEGLIRAHLNKITTSDAILVFNEEKNSIAGYVGGNTLMEMAFAYSQGIEIFMLNPTPDLGYKDEIDGMLPIVLEGDVAVIDAYFKTLPKTFVSSKSPVKLAAISRAIRRAGIRTTIVAKPTQSNVAEQPMSIDETYEGAINRHNALVAASVKDTPTYFATVESGNHRAHKDHNTFGTTVVILEKTGGVRKAGINLDVEFPKEMTDKVPSQYPDLGVLVQQEYGSILKDPFPYFTGGKITRQKLVEDAVYNVAVQL